MREETHPKYKNLVFIYRSVHSFLAKQRNKRARERERNTTKNTLILSHAIAALISSEKFRGRCDRTKVSNNGADREQLVPAAVLSAQGQIIEDNLSHAHEDFRVQFAVVAPACELQERAAGACFKAQCFFECRVQGALLR